ncbi:conserved protein of unknown function [Nitrosotalea devaniterrae]|uniref:Uncharacterized protein n=1 Tax=Nitrosotalea devaniterrae TaxID=1078905 RepID=A0A128A1I4_9ARCH|nr:conserved protein of unknown function [Candidatus Nitrosotalea devanaterra]
METQSKNNETNPELPILKKGIFYAILDDPVFLIMEDRTKRGLTVLERSIDEKYGVNSDKGMIYDMDGIGRKMGIRWFFPKDIYGFDKVLEHATEMEQRYKKIREETCPDY